MRLPKVLILCSILLISFLGCNDVETEEQTVNLPKIKDVPASSWERLSKKRLYFGHHIVGYNIVGGLKGVIKDNPQIKLDVLEAYDPDEFDMGVLAHSKIGCDNAPKSKLDAFSFLVKVGAGAKADIVFFLNTLLTIYTLESILMKSLPAIKTPLLNFKKGTLRRFSFMLPFPLLVRRSGQREWIGPKKLRTGSREC